MEQDKHLSPEKIKALIPNEIALLYYPSVDSTNTEAKRLIKSGMAAPFLVTADYQSAGRGSKGRSFFSPAGTGIYMSLTVAANISPDTVKITSSAAVAVKAAAERLSGKRLRIKPINDIYLEDKKICGILCETVYDGSENAFVIVGVGMNVNTAVFPDELTSAGSLGGDVSREELISEITKELLRIL